jgi:GNAT superfamily N-acetyltransferase
MENFTFDLVEMADLAEVMAIERLDFSAEEAASESSMLERIERIADSFVVAKNADGRVVGFITGPVTAARYLTDDCFVHSEKNPATSGWQKVISLAVHPDFEGMGIARGLLTKLIEIARAAGRAGISLTCHDYLIPFYEKNGFVNEGISDSHLADEVWYDLVLEF